MSSFLRRDSNAMLSLCTSHVFSYTADSSNLLSPSGPSKMFDVSHLFSLGDLCMVFFLPGFRLFPISHPLHIIVAPSFLPSPFPSLVPLTLYKCIGAKLNILLHLKFLNSFPTTPFSLVPIGSPPLFTNTHALSSKFTTLPSGLWYFFFVRTTTACRMSPRRTLLAALSCAWEESKERCFWTTTSMRSPILA